MTGSRLHRTMASFCQGCVPEDDGKRGEKNPSGAGYDSEKGRDDGDRPENRGRRQKQILLISVSVFLRSGQCLFLPLFRKRLGNRLIYSAAPDHRVRMRIRARRFTRTRHDLIFRRLGRRLGGHLLRQSGPRLPGEKNIGRTNGALHDSAKETFISRYFLAAFRTCHFYGSHLGLLRLRKRKVEFFIRHNQNCGSMSRRLPA